jgi:hypothetical protein
MEIQSKYLWVKLEIDEEERVACSDCGELVSDQHLELRINPVAKVVDYVSCAECCAKWKDAMKKEAQAEGDR